MRNTTAIAAAFALSILVTGAVLCFAHYGPSDLETRTETVLGFMLLAAAILLVGAVVSGAAVVSRSFIGHPKTKVSKIFLVIDDDRFHVKAKFVEANDGLEAMETIAEMPVDNVQVNSLEHPTEWIYEDEEYRFTVREVTTEELRLMRS